jgi:hypothetical protein
MIHNSAADDHIRALLFRALALSHGQDMMEQQHIPNGEDCCSIGMERPVTEPLKNGDDASSSMFFTATRKKSSRIQFDSMVTVVRIPSHSDYSPRLKKDIWSSGNEIRMNARRNKREFASEKWDWQQVVEEDAMFRDTYSNEFIHPVHLGRLLG